MPSPLVHTAAGYVIYRIWRPQFPEEDSKHYGPVARLLLITMSLSMLPDLDSVVGILLGNFGRFHNNLTHSLIVGVGVAMLVGSFVWLTKRSGFGRWFLITLLCYEGHVILDFLTFGRGVMAFWPLSSERFLSPLILFYGLHWSDGVFSPNHLWTLFTESAVALPLVVAVRFLTPQKSDYE